MITGNRGKNGLCVSERTFSHEATIYTNHYSEASIRIRKDILFQRNKAWNVVQMFNLLTQTCELYYQLCLISVATNRLDHFVYTRFTVIGVKACTIPSDDIVASDDPDVYTGVSQSDKITMWE